MSIPTSRTNETARIIIDTEKCKGCGNCVEVCKDFSLELKNGKASISEHSVFGCIACGHCMCICNNHAIRIEGRFTSAEQLFELGSKAEMSDYYQLLNLLKRRRSIREFKDMAVDKEIIDKILAAAEFSPMGIPPSDVNVVVFDTKEKVKAFSMDYCQFLNNYKWLVSNWFLGLMRPFWGKNNDQLFRTFVKPLVNKFIEYGEKDINIFTYDAPVALYFYGSPFTDPADPLIAATYAMLAAEASGLGSCMIGSFHPMIQYGKKGKAFREKYNIRFKSREGLILIIGYPKVHYKYGIERSFANEDWN
ncbi:MAG: nitroreductase family protein [Bacteroidetes bacterium]|nr:nitroreductase family protein [Bacteroidota bacterium]